MQNKSVAEWLLNRVMGPQRAEEVYGDLLEGAKARGSLWFWRSVVGVVIFYDSPWRLIGFTIFCGLFSSASFLTLNSHSGSRVRAALIGLLSLTAALVFMYWAAYTVSEGVRTQRWSEDTIEHFRQIVRGRPWKWGVILLTIAMFSTLLPNFKAHHVNGPFWSIFSLQQALTQITLAFRKTPNPSDKLLRDRIPSSPIHSQHWGER